MELNYKYIERQSELDSVLAWCTDRRFIVVDTETNGIDPRRSKLITIQLGDLDQQWVIDARVVNIESLKAVIEDSNVIKLGQNLKFDWQYLWLQYGWYMQNCQDTMLAEQILRCGLRAGAGLD